MERPQKKINKIEEVPKRIKYAPVFDEDGNEVVVPEKLPGKSLFGMLSKKDSEYLESAKPVEVSLSRSPKEDEIPASNDRYANRPKKDVIPDWKTRQEAEKEKRYEELQKIRDDD